MQNPQPKQWEWLAFVPIAAGLYWLLGEQGLAWILLAIVPGTLLLASGIALLLWPGDLRIQEFMGAGSLLGVIAGLFAGLPGDALDTLLCLLLSLASFLVAGRVSLLTEPSVDEAPAPQLGPSLYAKAALDEALLAYFMVGSRMPAGPSAERLADMDALFSGEGWLERPESFHRTPPAPESVEMAEMRLHRLHYRRLRFDSGFQPDPRLPGAAEWASHGRNQRVSAWLLRHQGEPRPWLLCIHGYRMGTPWLDIPLFRPGWLHHKLGLNLIIPVLPLHGPRRIGLRSGDGYLDYDVLNLLHAQTQALWDLRRTLAWVRQQPGGERVGVLGYSLGGYNTALLAQYEAALDFVIAGIPVVDLPSALWRHMPPAYRRYFDALGLDLEHYRRLLHPVSPLARPCAVPPEARYIFAGVADRVVLPEHPLALARHWQAPIQWYQGGHLSFRGEPAVRTHIEAAIARAGWPAGPVVDGRD